MKCLDDAIKKITEECQEKDYLIPFEEYLTNLCKTEAVAKKILAKEKNLEDAYDFVKGKAKERQVRGCACLPDNEVYGMIDEYYEINEPDKQKEGPIDIMDLI